MQRPDLRRVAHWIGHLLAILGILFVLIRIYQGADQRHLAELDSQVWMGLVILTLGYGLANFLLAHGWYCLLIQFGAKVSKIWAYRTYGLSQIGKYVPGNVFHLASRHSFGMSFGVTSNTLLKSTFWELVLISLAAMTCTSLVLPLLLPKLDHLVVVIVFIGACSLVGLTFRFAMGPGVAKAYAHYLVFLLTTSTIFVCLLWFIGGGQSLPLRTLIVITGAYLTAWVAGLVTPGAPAGIGVREFMLLLLLENAVDETDLLIAIFLGRLVTVSGDLLFYLGATRLGTEQS